MVLPNLAFNPQDSNNSIAGFASSGKNLRAVQTIATVSPFLDKVEFSFSFANEKSLKLK